MKNLITIVNSGDEVTKGGIVFTTNTPVIVYRNRNLWGGDEASCDVLNLVLSGQFVSYSFDGEANTTQETITLLNLTRDEVKHAAMAPSYSANYYWFKLSCEKLLEGFLGELDGFDFGAGGVTVLRPGVVEKVHEILCLLSVGYLNDAATALSAVVPDTDSDFLSAARLAQFVALFQSAAQ